MQAFGHNITLDSTPTKSLNNKLPLLNIVSSENIPEFYEHILKYTQNQGREVFLSSNKNFDENRTEQKWMFKVEDVISFIWEKDNATIFYKLYKYGNDVLLKYWLLHTSLPIYLIIENKYELIHAGGVLIEDKPILFIAPSFGGKSTLTDYFLQKQHPMISDDRVALKESHNQITAVSSYPYHRPYRKMEDLGIYVENFMQEEKPLHCIYVLESVDAKDDIHFDLLEGIEKFKALQYNFDFNLPLNKASSFKLIGTIASYVPVYKIFIPWDLNRLDEVYLAICQHSKRTLTVCETDVSKKSKI